MNKRGDITTDSMDTKTIMREYHEQFYYNTLQNISQINISL